MNCDLEMPWINMNQFPVCILSWEDVGTLSQKQQSEMFQTASPVLCGSGNGILVQPTLQEPERVELVLGIAWKELVFRRLKIFKENSPRKKTLQHWIAMDCTLYIQLLQSGCHAGPIDFMPDTSRYDYMILPFSEPQQVWHPARSL
jgi:hypothetical protein